MSHSIGDYTIENFDEDMKNKSNFEIEFDGIIQLAIRPYNAGGNRLIVVYNDGKKDRECDFVKALEVKKENSLNTGVTSQLYDWEIVAEFIIRKKPEIEII